MDCWFSASAFWYSPSVYEPEVISPPRHQGHQGCLPTRFLTQRREGAKSQRPSTHPIRPQITQILFGSGLRKPARSMSSYHPLVLYRRGAEAQRRRESTRIQRVARSWPPNGGQGPLEQAPVTIARDRNWGLFQRPALRERRPRHFSPLFNGWEGHTSFPDRREARRNRRAPGASAGGAFGRDKRSRLERTNVSPAVGDRSIAGCSAVNPRHFHITSATTSLRPLRLCGFLGRAALRLCVSVSLWFSRCLGGSPGCVGGKFEIRNSKFEI